MYLLPSSSPAVNNRKWNLGRMRGLRGLGDTSVKLGPRGLGAMPAGTWESMGGTLYQDPGSGYLFDTSTNVMYDANGNVVGQNLPASSGVQTPQPVSGGATNAGITTVVASQPSTSPLDYVSPQAAIAAGLPQDMVYNVWTIALARYPSPQAAISAGVPAGVVNQLWQQAHTLSTQQPSGTLSSGTLLAIGGGILALLALASAGKGRG